MKILVIVVNYKNHQETAEFVLNLIALKDSHFLKIIIANNDPTNDSQKFFMSFDWDERVKILSWSENLGYFGAANKAWQNYQSVLPNMTFDWVIVANSDLKIEDSNFIEKLIKMPQGNSLGVIGPSIVSNLSGQETNPYMLKRPSSIKMHLIKWIFANWVTCQFYQWIGLFKASIKKCFFTSQNASVISSDKLCYAVHGAFMIFSTDFFKQGGDFKHPVFLYNEEIQVAEFCKAKGLKIIYHPDLQVFHKEHGSIGLIYSKQILQYKAQAAKYFAEQYF